MDLLIKYIIGVVAGLLLSLYGLLKLKSKQLDKVETELAIKKDDDNLAALRQLIAKGEEDVAQAKKAYENGLDSNPDSK